MREGGRRRWRQVSAPLRMRPDFIIPGEAKCGTTSLYRYLSQHPEIFPASMKEPNNFWRHGASPLQCGQHYPLRIVAGVRRWFGKSTLTGEASPEYFTKTGVPKSIQEVVPGVRLIFLFRNPVDRAFSDHQMLVNAGVESRSFRTRMEQALAWFEDEGTRELVQACQDLEHHPARYLMRGCYADHLRPWLEIFPREQMLFLESEDFFEDPGGSLNQVFDFLGLKGLETESWEIFKKGRYNQEAVEDALRKALEDFYRKANRKLSELTGRNWSWA